MTNRHKGKTILIIEDDSDIRNFVSRLLELEGYQVFNTGDATEGMKMLQENSIDLLLLDLLLPGRDGWSILQEIKGTLELANIPVVALTAVAEPLQRRRTLKMGASAYLVKPLSVRMLKTTIRNILAKSTSRRQAPPEKDRRGDTGQPDGL